MAERRSRSPRRRSYSRSRSRSRSRGRGGKGGKQTGISSRWNEKGFCFIKPDDEGEDIFCHHTGIQDGNCLKDGTPVTYETAWDERQGKLRAENVYGGYYEEKRSSAGECYAWRDGDCYRGDTCKFSHSGPGGPGGGGGGGRDRDDRRGGYDDRRGGYDDRRGSYDDRRGGYDDRRGGYDDRRGGYDDRREGGRRGGGGRGGYDDDRRGGYDDDRRGGYDDDRRGGYDDRRGGGRGDRGRDRY